jgi:hypothetical protein
MNLVFINPAHHVGQDAVVHLTVSVYVTYFQLDQMNQNESCIAGHGQSMVYIPSFSLFQVSSYRDWIPLRRIRHIVMTNRGKGEVKILKIIRNANPAEAKSFR